MHRSLPLPDEQRRRKSAGHRRPDLQGDGIPRGALPRLAGLHRAQRSSLLRCVASAALCVTQASPCRIITSSWNVDFDIQ